jgi:hypothetical protein
VFYGRDPRYDPVDVDVGVPSGIGTIENAEAGPVPKYKLLATTLTTYGFSGAHDGHQILTDFSHILVTGHAGIACACGYHISSQRLVSLWLLEWVHPEYKRLLPNA